MDIQTSKIELVKLIINLDNKKIIDKVLDILKSEQEDFWLNLSPQEKDEIQMGIKQLDEGKKISWEDFLGKVS